MGGRLAINDDENRLASLTAVEVQVEVDERGRYPGNVATAAMPRIHPGTPRSDVGNDCRALQRDGKRWEISRQRSTNDGKKPGSFALDRGGGNGGYLGDRVWERLRSVKGPEVE